jgi:hypothetical protein
MQMSYDHWKTTDPADEWLGPEPESEVDDRPDREPDQAVQEAAAAHAAEALREQEIRLPCGCIGKCDPFAHDTAPDWDGRPDGPYYSYCPECDEKVYEGEIHQCEK